MEDFSLKQGEVAALLQAFAASTERWPGTSAGREPQSHAAEALSERDAPQVARADLDPGRIRLTAEVCRLAALIDHALLRPEATREVVEQHCQEARQLGFAVACVYPTWVPLAVETLHGSSVKVGTTVGFPFGTNSAAVKRAEAQAAILAGAQEIDMVMNIGAMRSGEHARVESDIRGVVDICHASGVLLKVILENAYLSDEQKVKACQIAQEAGADYVKTSTGFAPSGATVADVRLMRKTVGASMGVKASGGIRTVTDALRMLEAGATRLGTSAGVAILAEAACL